MTPFYMKCNIELKCVKVNNEDTGTVSVDIIWFCFC